jgi:hypothetical protein
MLALAAATLRTDRTIGGELTGNMDIGGVLGAVADLERPALCRDWRCNHDRDDDHRRFLALA